MKRKKIDRNEIISTAILLADKKGYSNISLKEIADSLDIKTPSLYNHINGLDELYDLLAQEGLKRLLNELVNSVIGLSGKQALLSMGKSYIAFASSSPNLYLATQQVSTCWSDATKELSEEIINFIFKIISIYNLSKEQNIHVVRTLRSYLHGFALLKSQDFFKIPLDINKSFEIGFESILKGLELS